MGTEKEKVREISSGSVTGMGNAKFKRLSSAVEGMFLVLFEDAMFTGNMLLMWTPYV